MKIPHNHKDLLLKFLADALGGEALAWMGVPDARVVGAIPTEQPVLELRGQYMDNAFLTDTGVLLHLEYQTEREPDLYRFLQYDTMLASRHKRPVRTVVLNLEGLEAPERLDAGNLKYCVDNVFLKARDGREVLERIERHVRTSQWTVWDRLDLAFLPFMHHPGWTNRDVVARTAQVARAIPDEDERNLAAALILLVSAKNLSEEDVLRLKEALMMTDVVKVIARDEYEKGVAKGIEQGIEQGIERGRESALIETARNMLAAGVDVESICRFTQLDREQVEKLKAVH